MIQATQIVLEVVSFVSGLLLALPLSLWLLRLKSFLKTLFHVQTHFHCASSSLPISPFSIVTEFCIHHHRFYSVFTTPKITPWLSSPLCPLTLALATTNLLTVFMDLLFWMLGVSGVTQSVAFWGLH